MWRFHKFWRKTTALRLAQDNDGWLIGPDGEIICFMTDNPWEEATYKPLFVQFPDLRI